MAFAEVGLNWRDHVVFAVRSSEIMWSLGDPSKAAKVLDWRSTVKFPEIVARMVRADREDAASVPTELHPGYFFAHRLITDSSLFPSKGVLSWPRKQF
jgi:hypothetical protein